jgi:MFS family permease
MAAYAWSCVGSARVFVSVRYWCTKAIAMLPSPTAAATRFTGVNPRLGSRTLATLGFTLMAVGTLLFVLAPDRASYAADLLPGFVAVGFGVGLVFPAVSVTAMSDVQAERSGLASGLLMTGHEIGAALGVAVLSAIAAAGAGGSGRLHAGLAAGYQDGFLAATIIAAALAVTALLALPAVRPEGPAPAAMH